MEKTKLLKLIQNNIHFIGLVVLVIIAFLSTTYYSSYKKTQIQALKKTLGNIYLKKTIISLSENLKPRYEEITIEVKDSDTFEKILNKINVPESEIKKVLTNISKLESLNKVYKNQKISFKIDRKEPIINSLIFFEVIPKLSIFFPELSSNNFPLILL